MSQPDVDLLADIVASAIKEATAPLLERMAVLQIRLADVEVRGVIHGKDGRDGVDGKDGLAGEPGTPGANGVDGLQGPAGLDGKDGAAGRDGESVDVEALAKSLMADLSAQIVTETQKAFSSLELPKDGRDGLDGQKGADGRDGKDAVGILSASISQAGELILGLTDGTTKAVGVVVGKEGTPGRDGLTGLPGLKGQDGTNGIDGLGFDDIQQDFDGERTLRFVFRRGDREKVLETLTLPYVIDKGVYEAGRGYQRGDGVSFAGSFFIAQKATTAKPETSSDWRLAVKRGRDGKDGKVGK